MQSRAGYSLNIAEQFSVGQRAGGDHRGSFGNGDGFRAHDFDQRLVPDDTRDHSGKAFPIDRERAARGDAALVRAAHNEGTHEAKLLLQEPDSVLDIIRAEGVGADELRKGIELVRGRKPLRFHVDKANGDAALCQLISRLASGEAGPYYRCLRSARHLLIVLLFLLFA